MAKLWKQSWQKNGVERTCFLARKVAVFHQTFDGIHAHFRFADHAYPPIQFVQQLRHVHQRQPCVSKQVRVRINKCQNKCQYKCQYNSVNTTVSIQQCQYNSVNTTVSIQVCQSRTCDGGFLFGTGEDQQDRRH